MRYYSIASFEIQDYKQFKDEFDAIQDTLRNVGFKRTYLNRDADDSNHLIVVHEFEDLQKARDFYKSQDFRQCMERAGVIGQPQITFMEELARTPQLVSV